MPELPAEVLERIITRPEDLPEQVEKNIRKYKVNLLRMLEVRTHSMARALDQRIVSFDMNRCNFSAVCNVVCLLIETCNILLTVKERK